MPDEPGIAQLRQRAEMVRERCRALLVAPVHHVQVIAAELAQVLLDLPPQLRGRGRGHPLARRIPAGPDLGHDDQVIRYGASAVLISSLSGS